MKSKMIILLIASMILSLISVILQNETNRFGFPINFLFYRGGHYEPIPAGSTILDWENLRHSSFRIDLYVRNTLLIYCIFILFALIAPSFIPNKKFSKR